MSTFVVGDVHGCAHELEEFLSLAGVSRVVLVGDLFSKGPDPVGVWRLIREHRLEAVLGNHDAALLAVQDTSRDDHAARCAAKMDRSADGWRDWVGALPLFGSVGEYTVVHAGLHPSGCLERTTRAHALTMRHWPFRDRTAPRWHEVYTGNRRVIFGHDARGGLVRVERDGVPWLVGLDTGCVYGGRLSGWCPEDDRYLHVPARRVYRPVS